MLKKLLISVCFIGLTILFGMSIEEVNHASKETLMEIKGIGSSKADEIVTAREKHLFESFDELKKLKGIGPVTVENIKKDIKTKAKKRK
jgi:competence protein ComEA